MTPDGQPRPSTDARPRITDDVPRSADLGEPI
jgi:hypothetical protein